MPKVPSSSSTTSSGPNAHVLRRNQACHQCRRRKLKCDAKRPCSTCVRSHSYAVAHAPAGADLPPHPECTFDEVSNFGSPEPHEPPKNRFERLESRINELEALLFEKDKVLHHNTSDQHDTTNLSHQARHLHDQDNSLLSQYVGGGIMSANGNSNVYEGGPNTNGHTANGMDYGQFQMGSALESLAGVASMMGTSGTSPPAAHISPASDSPSQTLVSEKSSPSLCGRELLYISWPPNLPDPELLKHLVDSFFAFHPFANRLFHAPTFLSWLSLPPTHPDFPAIAVLHAICAVGSLFAASIPPAPHPRWAESRPDEVFPERMKQREKMPDSFAEQQAKFARHAICSSVELGLALFPCVQAQILLTWFNWCQAKWSEAFMSSGSALRAAVPCGLNICPPFYAIADSLRPPAIIPEAQTAIEDETRRNTFWLAYGLERTLGAGNGWALSLDDQDVCQLLPVKGDAFERGTLVPPSQRQWSHDRDMLLVQTDEVDSFALYVKGTIMLSLVKNFNTRFRGRYHAGDASVTTPQNTPGSGDLQELVDPRDTPAFQELDRISSTFKASFPAHLKNPVENQKVDVHLYSACLAPHLAQILLHEPHASIGAKSCVSSCRILTAARSILQHVYDVWSTSFDPSLLGLFPLISWFMAGRVLVRFLRAALDEKCEDHYVTIQAEVAFIRTVITKVGQRIPLAHRYGKMLHDFLVKVCGEQFADPVAPSANPSVGDAPLSAEEPLYGMARFGAIEMFTLQHQMQQSVA